MIVWKTGGSKMRESVLGRSGTGLVLLVLFLVPSVSGQDNPYVLWVPYVEAPSINFDGRISPGEWTDAGQYDVSDLLGFRDPPDGPGSVTLYASHDGFLLSIAIVNNADSSLSGGDLVVLWTDDTNNDTLEPLSEGYYQLEKFPAAESLIFFPHLGFPQPTGFSSAIGDEDGVVVFEAALGLGPLDFLIDVQVGATFGAWLGVKDGVASDLNGVWPPRGGAELVEYYGDIHLADSSESPPPSVPSEISILEDRPDTVVIEWDNPVTDLVGDSLLLLDSIRVYRDGIRIVAIPTSAIGEHLTHSDIGLELARSYSYRLQAVSLVGGSPRESPRSRALNALTGYARYESDFETADGGWTPSSDSSWQWGVPDSVGPGKAHSGMKCWATRLGEHYQSSARWRLVSPPIFLGTFPVSRASLAFHHFYWTEPWFDGGNVKVSADDGASWDLIEPELGYPASSVSGLDDAPGFSGFSGAWVYSTFDLSDYLGDTILVMLDFGSDGSTEFPGWYVDDVAVVANTPLPGIEQDRRMVTLPARRTVLRASPNPASLEATIEYGLTRGCKIELSVYNLSGRRVAVLERGFKAAGNHSFVWDLLDGAGDSVPSGVYFCRLYSGVSFLSEKLIMAR
jgi:hypothetical protein